jgi:predicted esterase
MRSRSRSIEGRLAARPTQALGSASLGLQPLELDGKQNGWLYVPKQYRQDVPAAFVLLLHGAGGDATGGLELLQPLADAYNTLLLAVDSSSYTWDVIVNSYGDDILSIDQALTQTFNRCAIDPTRLAIAGFSDGASYALSVGITNGDLFTHVIAFSPGFMTPAAQVGKPRVFISHGTDDRVLPIDRCSRRIVPQLQQANYDVLYQEFHGAHTVPRATAEASLTWFTAD